MIPLPLHADKKLTAARQGKQPRRARRTRAAHTPGCARPGRALTPGPAQEFGEELDKDGCATVGMGGAVPRDPPARQTPSFAPQAPKLHHVGPHVDRHQVELMKQADHLMFGMMGGEIPPAAPHLAAMQGHDGDALTGSPFAMRRALRYPRTGFSDAQAARFQSATELSGVYHDVTSSPKADRSLEPRWSALRQAELDIAERSVRSPSRSDQLQKRGYFDARADMVDVARLEIAPKTVTAEHLECESVAGPVIPSLQIDGLEIRESQCSQHSRSSAASGADTTAPLAGAGSDHAVGDAGIAVVLEVSSEDGGVLRVSEVEADSTAETSGQVRKGDFVLSIDGVSLMGADANANTYKQLSEGQVGTYASFKLMDPVTRQVRQTDLLRAMKGSQGHRFVRRHRRLVRAINGDQREGKERLAHNLQVFQAPESAVPNIIILGTRYGNGGGVPPESEHFSSKVLTVFLWSVSLSPSPLLLSLSTWN